MATVAPKFWYCAAFFVLGTIATIPNLQPQTVYEIYAKTLCSDATYSFSNSSIFVETKQIPVLTSYASNFEAQGDNGWILRNGTSVNSFKNKVI